MATASPAYKILLVDDDADILELLEYNLLKENFLLAKATNGKEAIAAAKTFQPHLIIMDVMMPEMDGIEAARQIKSNPEFKNTLILFLTARGEEYTEIIFCAVSGASPFSKVLTTACEINNEINCFDFKLKSLISLSNSYL